MDVRNNEGSAKADADGDGGQCIHVIGTTEEGVANVVVVENVEEEGKV
jgi:hypothetical protein